MNPLAMGHSTVCLAHADVAGFFASIEEFRPDFLIAGYSVFQEILRRAPEFRPASAQSRFHFLRAGSGRLGPDDVDRLEQLFGAPMLVGLSSTETMQIAHDPMLWTQRGIRGPAPVERGGASRWIGQHLPER
jgi:hypothetical protein